MVVMCSRRAHAQRDEFLAFFSGIVTRILLPVFTVMMFSVMIIINDA